MIKKSILLMSFALLGLYSCKKSEDNGEKIREMTEVIPENDQAIQAYLKSHYCELDSDGSIILGAVGSTGKTSIWDRADLKRKELRVLDQHNNYITNTMYYVILREGNGQQATVADRSFVLYKAESLDGKVYDDGNLFVSRNWMDLLGTEASVYRGGTVMGFREAVAMLKASASAITEQSNGKLVAPTDGGVGVFFMPSGITYYTGTSNIPAYTPLIFEINLLKTERYDHDGDGIPSINEIQHHQDGTITFPDCNGNGRVDYLDANPCQG
ncbi:FKBP-type peptidyl-prolyl cis-trans isomerase [Capnocytophaga granulosa]